MPVMVMIFGDGNDESVMVILHLSLHQSRVVVDSSISIMSVLLWMGSGVAVEAYP